jgi:hypothetical protein
MTKLNRRFNKETRETGFSSAPELPVHACGHHMKLLRLGKPLGIPKSSSAAMQRGEINRQAYLEKKRDLEK